MSRHIKYQRSKNPKRKKLLKLLIDKDISQAELALEAGCNASMINQVIHGGKRSSRVQKAIARKLGVPPSKIFGSHLERAA
jgi:transcriptional regulator with XRE-family HTH domain